jgi:Thioredoxin-like [2Fe-2S] ferredoxin
MSKHQKRFHPLTGYFLGWGDNCTRHGHIKLATVDGNRLIKVAKSLRAHIQDWQPGIYLTLITQETIDRDTGVRKIKVKQLVAATAIEPASNLPTELSSSPPVANHPLVPTKIQICQGSSCRKRGSQQICQSMQAYIDRYQLTDLVEIEPVKCLHQCKSAPQAIVTSAASAMVPGKTHYRQVQASQVLALLANHFPIDSPSEPTESNLSERVSAYLRQQHQIATATTI